MTTVNDILNKVYFISFSRHLPHHQGTAPETEAPEAHGAAHPGAHGTPAPVSAPLADVDLEKLLDAMAARAPERLHWKVSIVDLLKLLGLDSSLDARRELAQELEYTGDLGETIAVNNWLHREVMSRVAASGGNVPVELRE